MKKIYFLINSLAGGGAEKVALNLAPYLNVEKIFLLEKNIDYSVPKERVWFLSEHTKKTNAIVKTLAIPFYSRYLGEYLEPEDIVVSFLERANYVNILCSFWKKHKTIISVRMSQKRGRRAFHPYNFLNRIFYPKADLIIAVSRGIALELREHYGVPEEKIRVIYNPINVEEITELAKEDLHEFENIFKNPTLITSGRLTKQKGQWFLLRIFRELKKDNPKLTLIILGVGELKGDLIKLSQDLKLKTYVWDRDVFSENFDVYFLGFQKNPFKFIAKATLFVFPSLWEGFPNALIEAMACGVPVISSDCLTGPREILAPDSSLKRMTTEKEITPYGILLPKLEVKFLDATFPMTFQEKIWKSVLEELLSDERMRRELGERARLRAMDFNLTKVISQWHEILSSYV